MLHSRLHSVMADLCGRHCQGGFVPCVVPPANVDFSTHEEQLLCVVFRSFLLQVVSVDDSVPVFRCCMFVSCVSACHCVLTFVTCRLLVAS